MNWRINLISIKMYILKLSSTKQNKPFKYEIIERFKIYCWRDNLFVEDVLRKIR